MIGNFKHKGLQELYAEGRTRRIGTDQVRKCIRILQLLDLAQQPEDMNIAGFRFHGLHGNPKPWSVPAFGSRLDGRAKKRLISIWKITIREKD